MVTRKRRRPPPPKPVTESRLKSPPVHAEHDNPPTCEEDSEIWQIRDALIAADIDIVLPKIVRDTYDQIYDGQRTGRWDYSQLYKTEKTHIGTLLQINLQKELDVEDGTELDYKIAGIDVDCKWSRSIYDWEIPLEMHVRGSRIALLVWGSDYISRWAAGLLRIDESVLKPEGRQRDKKRRINELGKRQILWLGEGKIVENTLLHLDAGQRDRILQYNTGQKCINALFSELTGVLVNRATVLTVAQQDDGLKRPRDARKHLKKLGIVIFGHYKPHPQLAESLGLPRPTLGRFVSARLVLQEEDDAESPHIDLQGQRWRLARNDDPVVSAPDLPTQGSAAE